MDIFILPYNQASESAKALAHELKVKRIKKENSRFKGGNNKMVINWGCRELPQEVNKCKIVNSPEAITLCADKLKFFTLMAEKGLARTVDFTTDKAVALGWIEEKKTVMCRTILNGHSAQGLVIAEDEEALVDAPLYTLYVPKKDEYRIHVFNGEPFIVQRKALQNNEEGNPNVNWKVRNLANGFIFARNEGAEVPADVLEQAKLAVQSVPGLTFGSVDVLWNAHRKQAFVLEINTASGLTGTTITDYANKFREMAA